MKLTIWCKAALAVMPMLAGLAHAADDFLEPDQAFRLSARALDAQRIEVKFDIAPGYYLYHEKLHAKLEPSALAAGDWSLPRGKVKYDETFQKDVEVHREGVVAVVPLALAAAVPFKLTIGNQGCADKGLCYAPQSRSFKVEPGGGGAMQFTLLSEAEAAAFSPQASSGSPAPSAAAALAAATGTTGVASTGSASNGSQATAAAASPNPALASADGSEVSGTLRSGNPLLVVGVFLLLGLGLSFTPCVLPMMPILSSIIVGQQGDAQHASRLRGFSLALAYSLGMALVYTAAGVASALAGEGLGAALQNAWVLGAFALLLAVFSLAMFGAYELQMPSSVQHALAQASHRLPGGKHLGVFVMGGLSALIVGPCVAAPLAGALVYISQTRDVVLGGTALFSLAAGMSVPLLLLGLSAGALLPRAGAWMEHVKHAFGVMLLGTALWMVSPVLPDIALLWLTAVLLVVAAVYLGAFQRLPDSASPARQIAKGLGLLLGVFAAAQVLGAASGGRELLRPLAQWRGAPAAAVAGDELQFRTVTTVAELDAAVRESRRPVMLDFYADWCVACKEFEKFTFTDPAVRRKMEGLTLLRADVTANNEHDRALLKRYTLFGPPAMLFFAPAGDELPALRVIGFQNAEVFGAHLDRVATQAVQTTLPTGTRLGLN